MSILRGISASLSPQNKRIMYYDDTHSSCTNEGIRNVVCMYVVRRHARRSSQRPEFRLGDKGFRRRGNRMSARLEEREAKVEHGNTYSMRYVWRDFCALSRGYIHMFVCMLFAMFQSITYKCVYVCVYSFVSARECAH